MDTITTLLFDLDGTILDSKKAIVNVFYTLCMRYGNRLLSHREIDLQFGTSFREITKTFDSKKKELVEADYFKMMIEEECRHAKLFPSMRENLIYLKESGYRIGLITNKEREIVLTGIQGFNLIEIFDGIFTISDVKNPKPHREPIDLALTMLNASPAEAIMIGDTVFDVGAANNAGVRSAVIDWYDRYPLGEMRPEFYFRNMGEFMLKCTTRRHAG